MNQHYEKIIRFINFYFGSEGIFSYLAVRLTIIKSLNMKHKIWYDDADDIMYIEFTSDFLSSDVPIIIQRIHEFTNGKPYRQMIIKMSSIYKVENRETRELTNKGLQESGITEVAFVGGSAANRMIARVLIKTGIVKINGDFFKNYEEAIQWLKSKRS